MFMERDTACLLGLLNVAMPVSGVGLWSFAADIVGLNPTWGMDLCLW
jgi:hypothetical protein